MSVLIKNFGNDTLCQTVSELKKNLEEQHLNSHVSIISPTPSGIGKITFISILGDGSIIGTYDKKPICLNAFFN